MRIVAAGSSEVKRVNLKSYELRAANKGDYERFLMLDRFDTREQLSVAITAQPSPVVQRIYIQKGTFVFAGLNYISLRDFIEDQASMKGVPITKVLDKIIIPASDCKPLEDYLDITFGVN
ncbi:hypothetical protein V7128_28210 [Neobacillus vireti]|uniref:hypothetical protein n=1 Tax=Neobacillus vireti TaxID=220686 RepID=UPI002FFF2499